MSARLHSINLLRATHAGSPAKDAHHASAHRFCTSHPCVPPHHMGDADARQTLSWSSLGWQRRSGSEVTSNCGRTLAGYHSTCFGVGSRSCVTGGVRCRCSSRVLSVEHSARALEHSRGPRSIPTPNPPIHRSWSMYPATAGTREEMRTPGRTRTRFLTTASEVQ